MLLLTYRGALPKLTLHYRRCVHKDHINALLSNKVWPRAE
jgi:hypothetical protein